MRLSPLDIRKQEFTRAFRGCDADEVEAFLQMLSSQWEDLLDENRRRDEKIRDLENKMAHYEKVEEALQEALQTARETSRESLLNAEKKAKLIVESAERRAEDIVRDAEHNRNSMSREATELSSRRSEIIARLRAFLTSEMELLMHYEGDDHVRIRRLPAEERSGGMPENVPTALDDRAEGEEDYELDDSDAAASQIPPDVTPHQSGEDVGVSVLRDEISVSQSEEGRGPSEVDREYVTERQEPVRTSSRDDEYLSIHEESHAVDEDETSESDESEDRSIQAETESQPARRGNESTGGRGWTTRTVVPRPVDYKPAPPDSKEGTERASEEEGTEQEGTRSRASSEEIEKIRRILSGLD